MNMPKIVRAITEIAEWQNEGEPSMFRDTFTVHVNVTHGRQNLSTLNQMLKLTSAGKLYNFIMFAQMLLFTYTQG
jgi:hypothetical protein